MTQLWPEIRRDETSTSRWWRTLRNHPSAFLLGAQFLGIVLFPFVEGVQHGRLILSIFGFLVLVLAVWTVRSTPALTWLSAIIGVPAVALEVWSALDQDNQVVFVLANLGLCFFYFYTSYGLISYMFADHWVTRDEMFAAGATFTVLAWGFAYLYMAVQGIWDGSFTSFQGAEKPRTWLELLYYSFANLAGVGLSDVVAVKPHARAATMLEQIVGVLYIAMVISRLVALTVLRRR